ncbi:hypothetical protein ABT369_57705 [Dactylosporangium sp. NPDC000244]|uniref:hypothetical protein n=1 Tax=Dactylosporangium sp. NPDC000244 TaxID=3154365 RepID=UPI00332A1C0E
MQATEMITTPLDERLADYRALTDLELRTRWEPPNGLFIAEGELVLRRALRAGYRLRSVLIDTKRVSQLENVNLADIPVYAGDQATLEAITGFHVHRGVLASFHRKPELHAKEILRTAQRPAILENIHNHTNVNGAKLPTILASARAARKFLLVASRRSAATLAPALH